MSKQDISRTEQELTGVTLLGNTNTDYKYDYDPSVLEHFPNKHPENDYVVTFDGYEFTSLCPKTGQPDFAKVFINYIPNEKMVESKSLKLYLFSFRNHGDFHEDCMNIILNDLYALMEPKYIEVMGLFTPRGGISIYPFVNKVNPNFETPALKELELSRKLNFMSGVQNYGRAIR
ncbi:MAG: NADPH-dependent 7-cyano-7-deazaguanine reductase QueF [Streptococcus sp.]|nr:MAG: NADPH-dependent 7-cyano-7-deazaguanine reductase QueF [Streptococcus sp.]DAK37724.1 MAG TPA: 7-cyano-7-deazaguanine reductase [Caudoviricetes sp.]